MIGLAKGFIHKRRIGSTTLLNARTKVKRSGHEDGCEGRTGVTDSKRAKSLSANNAFMSRRKVHTARERERAA